MRVADRDKPGRPRAPHPPRPPPPRPASDTGRPPRLTPRPGTDKRHGLLVLATRRRDRFAVSVGRTPRCTSNPEASDEPGARQLLLPLGRAASTSAPSAWSERVRAECSYRVKGALVSSPCVRPGATFETTRRGPTRGPIEGNSAELSDTESRAAGRTAPRRRALVGLWSRRPRGSEQAAVTGINPGIKLSATVSNSATPTWLYSAESSAQNQFGRAGAGRSQVKFLSPRLKFGSGPQCASMRCSGSGFVGVQ